MVTSLEDAIRDADLIALLVPHIPLRELDPFRVAALTPARIVVDTVNGWSSQAWEAAGFLLFRMGAGHPG
jgi:UDP-N-acetyl-D-mannosaminuronic acid dehydrogenase